MSEKKIRVRLVHSTIGRDEKQEKIIKGLGLRKLHGERDLIDTPAIRGMIAKVPHLVQVVEGEVGSPKSFTSSPKTAKTTKTPKARKAPKREAKENEAQ